MAYVVKYITSTNYLNESCLNSAFLTRIIYGLHLDLTLSNRKIRLNTISYKLPGVNSMFSRACDQNIAI